MNFELENKVALVTGGSKNIGKEIALCLASEKVNIAFTYNSSENQAEETLNEIKKFGVQAKAYKLDISKLGIRIGAKFFYTPIFLKKSAIELCAILWKVYNKQSQDLNLPLPKDGRVSFITNEKI